MLFQKRGQGKETRLVLLLHPAEYTRQDRIQVCSICRAAGLTNLGWELLLYYCGMWYTV